MEQIQYYNRLINCIDPAKDAGDKVSNGVKLTQQTHGQFIVEKIIKPLFQADHLDDGDRQRIRGVADNKDYLKQRIRSIFTLNDWPTIQFNRLSFTDTGRDPRPDDMYVAHDAGLGPDKLFKQYTLILTPGSVLDPGSREKSHDPHTDINAISAESRFSPRILKELDLSKTISNITFTPSPYEFKIQTDISGFENKVIRFNRAFKEQDSDWCKGNATKNQFLMDNWEDPKELGKIQFYFLMKELGDTLQVAWLKQIIEERGLDRSKAAICTHDINAWLRAIVNGVSSIHVEGHVATVYPVASTAAEKALREVLVKQRLFNEMKSHNEDAIKKSIEGFICLLDNPHLTFAGKPISPENRVALSIILISVKKRLRREFNEREVGARLQIGSMDDFRKYIDNHKMQKPFRQEAKTTNFVKMSFPGKFFFFPRGINKIEFKIDIIYRMLNNGKTINENDIRNILSGIPIDLSGERVEPCVAQGGSPDSFEDIDDITQIFVKNSGMPGLLSYIIINYFPELMFISYAYSLVFNYSETARFDILFDNSTAKHICAPFKRILNDNTIEYDAEHMAADFTTIDQLMYDMCLIGAIAYHHRSPKGSAEGSPEVFSVFDYAYQALKLFTVKLLELTKPEERDKRVAYIMERCAIKERDLYSANVHLDALNVYGELVDAEISLTTLNQRDTKNPIAHRVHLIELWKQHAEDEEDKLHKLQFTGNNSPGKHRGRTRNKNHARSRARSRSVNRGKSRASMGSRTHARKRSSSRYGGVSGFKR